MSNMLKRRKLICTIFLAAACLCAGVALIFARGNAPVTYADEVCVHDYSVFVRKVDPTCTDDGYDIMRCSLCGETANFYHYGDDYDDYEESYQALGHLWDEKENVIVVAPTCTESGVTYHYCPRCGGTYTEKPTSATGHEFDETPFAPDCTTGGYTVYYCKKCGYNYTGDYTDPLGHTYIRTITPATCTAGGRTYFWCSVCYYSYTGEYTDALGHDYVDEVVESGCEAYGYTLHTCSRCEDSYYDSVTAPYGHLFDGISQVVATETEYGYVKLSCSVCGYVYITNIVSPGEDDEEHDFVLTINPADCYGGGYWIYECADCEAFVICNETDSLEHEWVSEYVSPTCTEPGGIRWVCLNCEDAYWETVEEATGHSLYVSVSADVTCTEDGYTVCDCRDCSYTYMTVTPATGHIYEVKNVVVSPDKTLSLTYTCYSCSSSAISRLYVVFAGGDGGSYTYLFDSDGTLNFSSLSDGFYTATVYDAVLGEAVFMFVTGEESSDEGSSDGSAGGEHVHSYVPSVTLNASAKTVTVSYKCSCGDDLTGDLYVTFISEDGTVSVSYSADAKGVVSYAELGPGTYKGYVYYDDLRLASFNLTVPDETSGGTSAGGAESGTTGGSSGDSGESDNEGSEHIHEYEGKITIDTDSMTMNVSYECPCGENLAGEIEVAILDEDGDVLVVYYPDSTGFVDFSEDVSDGEYYVVASYEEDVIAFETMKMENTSIGDVEDGDPTFAPSKGEASDEEKSGNGTIIALLVVFLVVVAGGIAAWVIYKRRKKKKEAEAAEESDATENLDDEDVAPSERNNDSSGNRYFDDDDDD